MILATLSLFVMLTATSVYAQFDSMVVAKIPFEFVIGTKTFPEGEYTITYMDTHLIRIHSKGYDQSMFVVAGPAEAKKMGNILVFNRYGDRTSSLRYGQSEIPGRQSGCRVLSGS